MKISLEISVWVLRREILLVDYIRNMVVSLDVWFRPFDSNLANVSDHLRQDDSSLELMSRVSVPQVLLPNALNRGAVSEDISASMSV